MKIFTLILIFISLKSFALPSNLTTGTPINAGDLNANFNKNRIYSCSLSYGTGSPSGNQTMLNPENDCDEWLNGFDDDEETFTNAGIAELSVKTGIFSKKPICWVQLYKAPTTDGPRSTWYDPSSTKDNLKFKICYHDTRDINNNNGSCQGYHEAAIYLCKESS